MKKFLIADLAWIIKAHEPIKIISGVLTGVSIDSRTIEAGDCFFAIAGDNFDGHNYLHDAFAKGAACAVISKETANSRQQAAKKLKTVLKVDDTIKALGDFAKEYRRQMNFKVIAITGSAGKTTTRQIIYHVLSQHHYCHQAPKNFNNNIGLPLTLLGADPKDESIIAELGSNHPGEIAYLTRIAGPDIAVVTNVHPAHLEGFGNVQTIILEKLSISEGLRDGGEFLINGDCSRLVDTGRAKGLEFTTFGKSESCDIQAENIIYKTTGSKFTIDDTEIDLPLPGAGNVENTLAAWSVCRRYGINIDNFACAVKTLTTIAMRAELLKIGTLTILNDCYNANPASMKNALDILAGLSSCGKSQNGSPANLGSAKSGRLVFVCGDMAELGQQAEHLHAELGASIAQAKVQLLLAVGKFAKITAETAKKKAEYNLQTKCFKDTLSACNNLQDSVEDNDIILVKGSRTAELETVIEKLKEIFS